MKISFSRSGTDPSHKDPIGHQGTVLDAGAVGDGVIGLIGDSHRVVGNRGDATHYTIGADQVVAGHHDIRRVVTQ